MLGTLCLAISILSHHATLIFISIHINIYVCVCVYIFRILEVCCVTAKLETNPESVLPCAAFSLGTDLED